MGEEHLRSRGGRILLVEDDHEMRSLISDSLSSEGFEVTQAEDGEAAAAKIAREDVDLVITDIGLPGMSGLEFLSVIRAKRPGLPVIVVTAFGDRSALVPAGEMEVGRLISKPFKTQELIAAVREALIRKGGGLS